MSWFRNLSVKGKLVLIIVGISSTVVLLGFALKLLLDPTLASSLKRFQQEARVLARLSHPNLLRVHDYGEAQGISYLASEYLEGEDLGAIVVTDSLCVGTRSFWDLTDETRDPLESLADRYFKHVPCPRMAGAYATRLDFIKAQVERAHVQGVILENIKFCDLHGTDNALLRNDLEKQGIPTIELERQYGPLADAGRIRTRVQAFLERIGS